jgi:hypothetical protein
MKNIDHAPKFIKLTLWGINSRASAMTFLVLSLVLAVGAAFLSETIIAILFAMAAAFYFVGMRWVDKNANWD